jgi:hypothetical protein
MTALPERPVRRGVRTAIVLIAASPALEAVQKLLDRHALSHRRIRVGRAVIFVGLEASDLQRAGVDRLTGIDGPAFWPPEPVVPDGFN